MNSTDENTTNQKDAILVLNDIYKNKTIYIGTANVSNTNATFTVNEKSKLIIKKRVKDLLQYKLSILITIIVIFGIHYLYYKPGWSLYEHYIVSIFCMLPIPYYLFLPFLKGFTTTVFQLKNLSLRAKNDLYTVYMINFRDDRLILLNTIDRDRYNNNDFVELRLRQTLDLLETPTQLELAMRHTYRYIEYLLIIISYGTFLCLIPGELNKIINPLDFVIPFFVFFISGGYWLTSNIYTEIINEKLIAMGVYY